MKYLLILLFLFFPILSYGQAEEIPALHPVAIWAQENFDNLANGIEYYPLSRYDTERMKSGTMYYVARVNNESIYVETLMQVWDFWTVDMKDNPIFGQKIQSTVLRDWTLNFDGYDKYYQLANQYIVRVRYQNNVLLILTKAPTLENPLR